MVGGEGGVGTIPPKSQPPKLGVKKLRNRGKGAVGWPELVGWWRVEEEQFQT